MNDMPLVRAGPDYGLNEQLLVSSLRGGVWTKTKTNTHTGMVVTRLSGPRPFEQFGTALDLSHHDTHIRQWPKVRAEPNVRTQITGEPRLRVNKRFVISLG